MWCCGVFGDPAKIQWSIPPVLQGMGTANRARHPRRTPHTAARTASIRVTVGQLHRRLCPISSVLARASGINLGGAKRAGSGRAGEMKPTMPGDGDGDELRKMLALSTAFASPNHSGDDRRRSLTQPVGGGDDVSAPPPLPSPVIILCPKVQLLRNGRAAVHVRSIQCRPPPPKNARGRKPLCCDWLGQKQMCSSSQGSLQTCSCLSSCALHG